LRTIVALADEKKGGPRRREHEMKIGTIGLECELLQALARSDLEVVAIAGDNSSHARGGADHGLDRPVLASRLQLVRNPIVDGVILSVDSRDRFFLAHEALKAGKHVLVDSQLAPSLGEAAFLESFARSQERVLLTGHPAVRSEAVRHAHSLLRTHAGALRILTSRRRRAEPSGNDIGEPWDRMACDIGLFDVLTDTHPAWVSTVASFPGTGAAFGSLYLTLHYETPHGSVLGQIELCEGESGEKDRVSARADGLHLELHEGSAYQIDLLVNGELQTLPVANSRIEMYEHFAACVNANGEPGEADRGLNVARTLDAARRSLYSSGRAARV